MSPVSQVSLVSRRLVSPVSLVSQVRSGECCESSESCEFLEFIKSNVPISESDGSSVSVESSKYGESEFDESKCAW